MNLKESIKKVFSSWLDTYKSYPVTLTFIFLLTVFTSVVIESFSTDSNILSFLEDRLLYIYVSAIVLILTTFLGEVVFSKTIKKILFSIAGGVVSVIFFILLNKKIGVESYFLYRLIACYCVSFVLLILYFLTKKSNVSSENYLVLVVQNWFVMSFIYGIIANGLIYIVLLFSYLFVGNVEHGLFSSEVLLFGFFYLPQVIRALTCVGKEKQKTYYLTEVVIKYLLKGIVIVAFVIVYAYMAKIVITWNIPSNEIFRILASLFIISCPVWTMANSLTKKKSKLPLFFIPFIFLQIFSIGVRIFYNGLTPIRYFGIVLIILEIVYIFLYCFKKDSISKVLLVTVGVCICFTIVPKINYYDLCIALQEKNIKVYLEKDNLSDTEKKRIYSAYDYLSNEEGSSSSGSSYRFNIISEADKNVISNWDIKWNYDDNTVDSDYERINLVNDYDIVVDGYKNIYEVTMYDIKEGMKVYYGANDKYSFVVSDNFMNAVKSYRNNYLDNGDYNYYVIPVDDKLSIVWNTFEFRFYSDTDEMKDIYIHGYILSK